MRFMDDSIVKGTVVNDRLVKEGLVFHNAAEYRFVNPFFREWILRAERAC